MPRGSRNTDSNHNFPSFESFSRLLPGEERIRENILVKEPIKGLPIGSVSTVYDAVVRGVAISDNGPFLGEIVNGHYQWSTYKEVLEEAQTLGSAMVSLGLVPGEDTRVGLAGIHSVRYMMAVHASVSYGMVIVPLYHNSKVDILCEIIDSCGLSLIFCDTLERARSFIQRKEQGELPTLKTLVVLRTKDTDLVEGKIEGLDLQMFSYEHVCGLGKQNPVPVSPPKADHVYIICHTSGTTGRPKGVQLTHRNLLASVAGLQTQWMPPPNNFQFSKNDVYFSFLSLAHIYEHLMQTFTVYVGGRVGIYSGDVSKLLADIKLLRPTILSLVPRLLNKFHDSIHNQIATKNFIAKTLFKWAKKSKLNRLHAGVQRYDTIWDKLVFKKLHQMFGGRLRMVTTGGAPVTAAVKEFARIAYGCPLMEGYGQTECVAAGTLNLPFDFTSGQVGGPAPWAQIKLVDVPDLGYFSKDDKGEVCFRGAAVMRGYFNDRELTEKTIDKEGWLHTGDIGMWQNNGSLCIIDRKNAIFKLSQGDFVSPESIEAVYLSSPLLTQLYVTGDSTQSHLVGIGIANVAAIREIMKRPEVNNNKLLEQQALLDEDLLSDLDVRKTVLRELNKQAKKDGLQTIELIRNIHLIYEEFTAESGLLTPTLKLRRHLLKQKFLGDIQRLYEEGDILAS